MFYDYGERIKSLINFSMLATVITTYLIPN